MESYASLPPLFVITKELNVARKPVWETKDPTKKDKKLSPKKKAAAKARAKAAGRPYPNLVDNMAAARKKKK